MRRLWLLILVPLAVLCILGVRFGSAGIAVQLTSPVQSGTAYFLRPATWDLVGAIALTAVSLVALLGCLIWLLKGALDLSRLGRPDPVPPTDDEFDDLITSGIQTVQMDRKAALKAYGGHLPD